jgi:hypothetical protein
MLKAFIRRDVVPCSEVVINRLNKTLIPILGCQMLVTAQVSISL